MKKQLLKYILPSSVQKRLALRINHWKHCFFLNDLRRKIITYYSARKHLTLEEKEILNFLKLNPLHVFPYSFVKKYNFNEIQIFYDEIKDLKYVNYYQKKLYFKRRMSEQAIKSLFIGLLIDQDENSPHRYLDKKFQVDNTDIVVDAGAAEGNFSLLIIDYVQKIILFESDPEWIEPLNATFEPWKDKVEIIQKKISDKTDEFEIKLDDFYEHEKFTFIKADIEGYESKLIEGLRGTLKKEIPLKLAICTYHQQEDFMSFSRILQKNHFYLSSPRGYMIFYYDKDIQPPFLRKGILRAEKEIAST
ncbi:FkbM family methyltransferase [Christiangramia sediminis]|uniref:Methyltransferase FkbM domain-containing protein n=1 Tax=Christiangramia sediminis TaxID=2881336 RepID=A0A9X1LJ97_9FLAO|nr:FkbM family methyltransferase [Christiangramia sediminis]MCB7481335.1 hypothetical protein [Christiangramia sediminis]